MTDTQWADVSEFQVVVTDAYPWEFFCFRSNDGNHLDAHFAANRAWADAAVASGRSSATSFTTSTDPASTVPPYCGPWLARRTHEWRS